MPLELQSHNWQLPTIIEPPEWMIQQVGSFAAQLLWQRDIRDRSEVEAFLHPDRYTPTSAFAFGEEIERGVARIRQAIDRQEKVVIWGDFDADGITATSVLWEGLGEFLPQHQQLSYYIPNRLHESHGLSIHGIDRLKDCQLIITCDNGSTNLKEIEYANSLGIDLIITDHHTLLPSRPPVVAIINPRNLERDHALFHLSGVAVAYKVIEALYETMPEVPTQPLENLLDLVAIGLVADLVQLTGDCRYLAQRGIEVLKQKRRLGVRFLLEQCKKAGDRPTDISFGIAPRINSVSRIWGDVYKCVELLTSKDPAVCQDLVKLAELANTQRKGLQKNVFEQVKAKIAQIDLSTTGVLVLADPNWSVGILGLVAGQVASEFGRPVILCNTEDGMARGSARSISGIDLYELIADQEYLLNSFGGHPLALGLSLPIDNLTLLKEALNQKYWQKYQSIQVNKLQIDLDVQISDLGQDLFRELKLLEPYGMGNPAPKLLVRNCCFEEKFNANIKDWKNQKVAYIKSDFLLVDNSGEIRGSWWGHYRDEIPDRICDVVVELVDNTFKKTYEVRIVDIWELDQIDRSSQLSPTDRSIPKSDLPLTLDRANIQIAEYLDPAQVWQTLVGIAKYLDRTGIEIPIQTLQQKLGITELAVLETGLESLQDCGWEITELNSGMIEMELIRSISDSKTLMAARQKFITALNELIFRQKYFDRQIQHGVAFAL